MYGLRRRQLSQNFLYSRKLVKQLVWRSSIGPNDTVLDIGSGEGIITEELLQRAKHVIAIEIDTSLYLYLKKKLKQNHNITLVNQDFLKYKLPKYRYKVFANIPFSIEGKIIRKLLAAYHPPEDCYLVMRKDLAERLSSAHRECQFSLFYKPWFEFQVTHDFRRTDFKPMARMDTVLLRFTKRIFPLVSKEEQRKYMFFIGQGFGTGSKIKQSLRIFFTRNQFRKISQRYGFNVHVRPSHLNLKQWVDLYLAAKLLGIEFNHLTFPLDNYYN